MNEKNFNLKKKLFKRIFDLKKAEQLRANLLISGLTASLPTEEYSNAILEYSHYQSMLYEEEFVFEFIKEYENKINPVLQGPFVLPFRHLISGPWKGVHKIYGFKACQIDEAFVSGKRVLDIGSNAGFDTFLLSSMQAAEVIGIEPSGFYYQSMFFWTVYDSQNTRFVNCKWQDLTKEVFGEFDLINCQGILYHEPDPLRLLQKIFELLVEGGTLVLETHVTMQNNMTARFIEGNFWKTPNFWWITDNDTTEAILRALGFIDVSTRLTVKVPSGNPDNEDYTIEGEPVGGRAFLTAKKPFGQPRLKSL
jgi:SAM-dependent methyltransferase